MQSGWQEQRQSSRNKTLVLIADPQLQRTLSVTGASLILSHSPATRIF